MGPEIFLVVMVCSNDLLSCEDRSSAKAFAEMGDCRAAEAAVLKASRDHDLIVLARCRYVLTHAPGAPSKTRMNSSEVLLF